MLPNRRKLLQISLAGIAGASGGNWRRAVAAENSWMSWRGPQRDGHCGDVLWPRDFSKLTKLWSIELNDSYSGAIVSGDRVFVTETIEQRDESIAAINRQNGEQLWKRQWPGAMSVPFFAKANGDWIRSTPATDGERIIVGGMRDLLACFDCETGEELWQVDCVKQFESPVPSFGLVCSPLIDGEHVYVQAGSGVRKLNMSDGQSVWLALKDSGGMMDGGAFSSPIISNLHGLRQLIVQTRTQLAGVDLDSGAPLWTQPVASFRGMNILTPAVWKDAIFTSCYGGKSQLFGFDPTTTPWTVKLIWEGKAEAYMSSPIIVGDYLYLHLRNKRFCCIDLKTGTETWRTTPFGTYWSMITNGHEILALDESGELLLIACNPSKFELLDRKQVSSEPSWAHVALAGKQIFIRRQRGLDGYNWLT